MKINCPNIARHLFIYLFIVNTIILFVFDKYLFTDDFWYGYNNPLVIINACVVFLLFLKIQIESRTVNYVAISAFAVYLLTDHNTLTRPYIVRITNVINDFCSNNIWYDLSIWMIHPEGAFLSFLPDQVKVVEQPKYNAFESFLFNL